MPFQGLILIGQVLPKLWPFIYQPMKRHVAAWAWLREKLRPTQIDSVIRAELPNPEEDPFLYAIVKRHMIHGPCG